MARNIAGIVHAIKRRKGKPRPILSLKTGIISRASPAWYGNYDNTVVRRVGNNAIRTYVEKGIRWYVLEGASTTHIVDSPTDISSVGGWTVVNTSTTLTIDRQVALAPDGSLANRINFGAHANDYLFDTDIALVANNTYRAGVWARTESGTQDFRIVVRESTNFHGSGVVHTATPTWKYFTITFTASATPTTDEFRIQQTAGSPAAKSILFSGATLQDDVPNIPTSPILEPSTTRLPDDVKFVSAALPFGIANTTGFWFMMRPYFSSAQQALHAANQNIMNCTGGTRLIRFNSAGGTLRVLGDIGAVDSAAKTWNEKQTLTVAMDWKNLEARFFGFTTGDETLSLAAAGDWDGLGTNLQFGASPALSLPYFGEISDLFDISTSPV